MKSGAILSYATQAVHILSALIYTPVMLRILGQSEYGLYQLVSSVVSYLTLLSMGFGSGYIRFFSRFKAREDQEGIAKLNGIFLIIFAVIAGLCAVFGGLMVWKADWIFGAGLTKTELEKARVLMAFMVMNLVITFINSVFASFVTAHEKFFFQRGLDFLRALFNPLITLPLLLLGYGSVGMVSIALALTVTAFVVNVYFCYKKLNIRFSFKNLQMSLVRELWAFTFFIFLNMIVDQINWNVDKFLLGRMLGTVAVATYGIASQLNVLYMNFSIGISSVFIPKVNFIIAEERNMEKVNALFNKVGRIQFIIAGLIISGFILFGEMFIRLWAGDGYGEAYRIGLCLLIPITIPLVQNIGVEIQRAQNKHRTRTYVYLFVSIMNIFISIPFIKMWGASGAAYGTMISLVLGNILFMNWYYQRKIGLDIIKFWKEIGKLMPAVLLSAGGGFLLKLFIPGEKIEWLVASVIVYCLVYIGFMWLFGLNKTEKDLIRIPLKKLGGNRCRKL